MHGNSACLFGKRGNNDRRAYIEITNICNMYCKHCMNNSKDSLLQELKKEQVMELFHELYKQNIRQIYISGGEPLLYEGIDKVLQHASTLGMKIILATNGLKIEEYIDTIKNCVHTVSISLDGLGETHDYFRGISGSYNHLVKMLALLKTQNIRTKISTIIWKRNVEELERMICLVKSMGVVKINFNILVPVGRAKTNSDIHISVDEYHGIYEKINELIEKYRDDSFDVEIKRRHSLDHDSVECQGGKTIFHINANGKVSPCSWLSKLDDEELFSFYWKKGNLAACIDACKKIDNIVNSRIEKYGYSGCPALANIHNGGFLSQDPLNTLI